MTTKKSEPKNEVAAIKARLKKSAPSSSGFKKKTQLTSWSFTRYWDYRVCPLKAKLKYLDKVEEPPNEAMERGADIGRLCELFIKGKAGTKVPDELAKFAVEFQQLRALYKKDTRKVIVEDTWAFTKTWDKTLWNDWNNCVVRVKIDAGHVDGKHMVLRDWKTGKYRAERREEYVEQLELYALGALLNNPFLEKVTAYLCYLDVGVTYPQPGSEDEARLTFTRADIPKLKKTWDKRTRALLLDKSFAPRPNDKCRWCHYRKENTPNLPGKKQLCKF